ncbi:ATP-binding protein [Caballeronia glebae]|uniref:ATP-binding protein n=1 Tax=Caballeronia glebae TaxID=1777143 RepID=UPI0038B8B3CF
MEVTKERVVLRIEDNGPGIPLVERQRVFDPFYRTLGSEQMGSGLGLPIVQTITDRIGAKIVLGFSDEAKQAGLSVAVLVTMAAPPFAKRNDVGRDPRTSL